MAEEQFGATVHLLDDGFQHLALARDVDLLMVSEEDLADRVLPAGYLREPLAAAAAADALLVTAGYESAAARVGRALGVPTTFLASRAIGAPRLVPSGDPVVVPFGDPVFLVAGIARPERFFSDIAAAGWHVAGTLTFRDHHRYSQRDVAQITNRAKSVRPAIVLTTDKDAVRLAPCDLRGLPIAAVPLELSIEPPEPFKQWLLGRIATARSRHPAPGALHPAQAPSTPHPAQAPSTPHPAPAPSTLHPAPSTQSFAPGTQPPAAPGTKHPQK
jgi:tetraacyldisaccharide 4'-kinase